MAVTSVPLTIRKDEERRRLSSAREMGDHLFRDMNIPCRPRNLFPVIRGSITTGVRWHKFLETENKQEEKDALSP